MDLREVIDLPLSHSLFQVIPCLSFKCFLELEQFVPHSLRGLGTELHKISAIKRKEDCIYPQRSRETERDGGQKGGNVETGVGN